MTRPVAPASSPEYDTLARAYGLLTAGYDYEMFVGRALQVAAGHGATTGLCLDAGCGTGHAFAHLCAAGWRAEGVDASARMLERAAGRARCLGVELHQADLRALPAGERADLVLCLDDVVNHFRDPGGLTEAFASIRARMADRGVLVFDANTPAAYQAAFTADRVIEGTAQLVAWRPAWNPQSGIAEAAIEIFDLRASGEWARSTARHAQRHYQRQELERMLKAAGLQPLGARGLTADGVLHGHADWRLHPKVFFAARRFAGEPQPSTPRKEVSA